MANDSDRPLRLLSLDGGGVKGITSLRILQKIFTAIKEEVGREVRPYEYFDLIGGTSTGGLIATMFGVLKMTVDEAIEAYYQLAPEIFAKKWWTKIEGAKYGGALFAHYWFNGKDLEKAVVKILNQQKVWASARFQGTDPGSCKVFVTAIEAYTGVVHLLRSYPSRQTAITDFNCTIVEAIRATAAAPLFFEPITIQQTNRSKATFLDGGMGMNNPVQEVVNEADRIWPNREIGCLLSIGTGVSMVEGLKPEKSRLHEILKACVAIATDADTKARQFKESPHGRKLLRGKKYFRFSVTQGVNKDDTGNFEKVPYMEAMTDAYARNLDFALDDCMYELMHPTPLAEDLRKASLPIPAESASCRVSPSLSNLFSAREASKALSRYEEHMKLGDTEIKSPRTDPGYRLRVSRALAHFTEALRTLQTHAIEDHEKYRHTFKKLMDTEESLSHLPQLTPDEKLAHLSKAEGWGKKMHHSALATRDSRFIPQCQHSLQCLAARKLELESRAGITLQLASRSQAIVTELEETMEDVRSLRLANVGQFEATTEYWTKKLRKISLGAPRKK